MLTAGPFLTCIPHVLLQAGAHSMPEAGRAPAEWGRSPALHSLWSTAQNFLYILYLSNSCPTNEHTSTYLHDAKVERWPSWLWRLVVLTPFSNRTSILTTIPARLRLYLNTALIPGGATLVGSNPTLFNTRDNQRSSFCDFLELAESWANSGELEVQNFYGRRQA